MKRVIMWALSALLVGCVDDVENLDLSLSSSGRVVTFNASPSSRVEGSSWSDDDLVGIFAYDDGVAVVSNKCYRITDAATGAMAAVDGTDISIPEDGGALSYYAYYPYDTERVSGTTFTIDLREQDKELALLWSSVEESSD